MDFSPLWRLTDRLLSMLEKGFNCIFYIVRIYYFQSHWDRKHLKTSLGFLCDALPIIKAPVCKMFQGARYLVRRATLKTFN